MSTPLHLLVNGEAIRLGVRSGKVAVLRGRNPLKRSYNRMIHDNVGSEQAAKVCGILRIC